MALQRLLRPKNTIADSISNWLSRSWGIRSNPRIDSEDYYGGSDGSSHCDTEDN